MSTQASSRPGAFEQLDTTEAQIHAQLAAQYRATLAELESLTQDETDEDAETTPDEPWTPI